MSPETLHILVAAPEGPSLAGLEAQLGRCRNPSVSHEWTPSLAEATSMAAGGAFELLMLDARLAPGLDRGLVALSPALLALPVVIILEPEAYRQFSRELPEGIMDYVSSDAMDPHALARILFYAARRYASLRSLQEAEGQLRAIVEGISDGIVIVDDREHVVFANPAAESILHRPLSDMLGASLGFPLPKERRRQVEVLSHLHDPLQLEVETRPIRWEGRQAQLASFRDITAQAALEENLRRSAEDAERVANLKTAFLANMSHELRMPLASIIGFAQLIREGMQDDEFKEFADSIIQGGNRLLETITSVLDLTRLDADAVQAQSRLVETSAVAREAVGMLGALASRKNLPVLIEPAEEDDTVFADPTILRRILNNLIGNAIKFTDQGSVRVVIEADDQIVRIHVQDTGRGIDPDFLPQLFEEFTQESAGYDRSHEGSGLGLAITKRLVRLIGGRIDVESEKGRGSTFTVTLPHADPDEAL